MSAVAKPVSSITFCKVAPTAARRCRPDSAGSGASVTGGMTVRLSFGNQRSGARPAMRDRRVNCRPSMRTGTSTAPARSATMPAPS